jgi:hypothetical protein
VGYQRVRVTIRSRRQARELGRKGGQAKAARARARVAPPSPFGGTILDLMDVAGLVGPSWEAWRTFWRVVTGAPLSEDERATFVRCTGRQRVPRGPLSRITLIVGRRGGKTRGACALAALYAAIRRDYSGLLAPGEWAVVPVVAADRRQARQVLAYLKGMCRLPVVAPLVRTVLKDSVTFATGAVVEVHSASWRSTRGYSSPLVVCDELAFFANEEGSANLDTEILTALRPALLSLPGSCLLCSSTPYAARGELFAAHERAYGRDDADAELVWVAPSLAMNATLDAATIAAAYEADPVAAASEYGAEFRRDVAGFVEAEAVRAVTVSGRLELPPAAGVRYVAFCDPSGGSQDAFTLAIAHAVDGRTVLDLVRERRPPFSPEEVVADFAATLKAYGVNEVTGDRYAGEWPRERFQVHGVRYVPSARVKSDLYRELLPAVNAGRVELLEVPRLVAQLVGLERRVARGGHDSVDHAPGAHDDLANGVAGALVLAGAGSATARDVWLPWFPGMGSKRTMVERPPFTPQPEAGRWPPPRTGQPDRDTA